MKKQRNSDEVHEKAMSSIGLGVANQVWLIAIGIDGDTKSMPKRLVTAISCSLFQTIVTSFT